MAQLLTVCRSALGCRVAWEAIRRWKIVLCRSEPH